MTNQPFGIVRVSGERAELAHQAMRINDTESADPDPAAIAEFLADRDCFLIVAVENGVVVGTLDGYALRQPHLRRPQFLLYEIDVAVEHRRRGIGRALVDGFADEARKRDAEVIWVLTHRSNAAAVALYRACGFAPDEEPDTAMMELAL
jgi:ribosomal protein S18 acetylase RimI-like enzyme